MTERVLVANRRRPPVSGEAIVLAAGSALLCAGALGWLSRARTPARKRQDPVADCADKLRQGSAVLAASVLTDSALEHFRGNYNNRLMYVPPLLASVTIATVLGRAAPDILRTGVSGTSAAVGTAGLGLHAYNILKRPGGLSWNNIFYAAPIAAPGALALSGLLGLLARRLETHDEQRGTERESRELGRAFAVALAGGILATVGEVALLHFRGAYHNPAMYAPVTVPPLAAVSLAAVGLKPSERRLKLSRVLLSVTAALGAIGTAFHAYGVHRNMGGWRNWTQNLFSGPPIPAPPSFIGLAIAGLGALRLIEPRR